MQTVLIALFIFVAGCSPSSMTSNAALAVAPNTFGSLSAASRDYLVECTSAGSHTRRAKTYDLDYFKSFLEQQGVDALGDVRASHIRDFMSHRFSAGDAAATVARRYHTVKHLYAWVRSKHLNIADPTFGIRPPKPPKRAPRWHTPAELDALRAVVSYDPKKAAIIEILARTGLRCVEIVNLKMGNLDMVRWRLVDVSCKANTHLDKKLHRDAVQALLRYLPERDELLRRLDPAYPALPDNLKNQYPLFVSRYKTVGGEPASYALNEKTVWAVVADASKAADIPHSHPHRLRHTAARRYYEHTGDVMKTRDFMGHQSVMMTEKYITTPENEVDAAVEEMP